MSFRGYSGVPELSQNVPKCPPEETLGVPKGYPKGYQKNTQKDQRDTGRVPHPTLRYGAVPKRYGAGMAHACACDATPKYSYKNRFLHQKYHFHHGNHNIVTSNAWKHNGFLKQQHRKSIFLLRKSQRRDLKFVIILSFYARCKSETSIP